MDYLIGQKRPGVPAAPVVAATQPGSGHPAGSDPMIVDGSEATFLADVVEASRDIPVIVDFWATWCGPCKTLTPALERVVRAAGGRVKLVKIDIDRNRALVEQLAQLGLPMQSVPTVAAFWKGQIADLFQGAQPESEIKRFVEALLKLGGGAMPTTELLAEARAAFAEGQPQDAAELFSAVLQTEPENPEAYGGLMRALLAMGEDEQATAALAEVPAAIAEHAEISGARAALTLAAEGRVAQGQLAALQARLEADPADHQARYDLATALNATDRRTEATDALLDIIRRDKAWNDGAARLQLLRFFESWGFDDAATMTARRKLSTLLFA